MRYEVRKISLCMPSAKARGPEQRPSSADVAECVEFPLSNSAPTDTRTSAHINFAAQLSYLNDLLFTEIIAVRPDSAPELQTLLGQRTIHSPSCTCSSAYCSRCYYKLVWRTQRQVSMLERRACLASTRTSCLSASSVSAPMNSRSTLLIHRNCQVRSNMVSGKERPCRLVSGQSPGAFKGGRQLADEGSAHVYCFHHAWRTSGHMWVHTKFGVLLSLCFVPT